MNFEDVIYKIEDEDLYMIGTSEHAMAAMHSKEIHRRKRVTHKICRQLVHVLEKKQGHMEEIKKEFSEFINLTKLSSLCFQSLKIHGKNTKKCYPILKNFIKKLEIPYRVMLLSTGDMGKISAKNI